MNSLQKLVTLMLAILLLGFQNQIHSQCRLDTENICKDKSDTLYINLQGQFTSYSWYTDNGATINVLPGDTLVIIDWSTSSVLNALDSVCVVGVVDATCSDTICMVTYLEECIIPNPPEICDNGIDDDGDGQVDEGCCQVNIFHQGLKRRGNQSLCDILLADNSHLLATQDCDGGGIDNLTECQSGGDPEDPVDDVAPALNRISESDDTDPDTPIFSAAGSTDCNGDPIDFCSGDFIALFPMYLQDMKQTYADVTHINVSDNVFQRTYNNPVFTAQGDKKLLGIISIVNTSLTWDVSSSDFPLAASDRTAIENLFSITNCATAEIQYDKKELSKILRGYDPLENCDYGGTATGVYLAGTSTNSTGINYLETVVGVNTETLCDGAKLSDAGVVVLCNAGIESTGALCIGSTHTNMTQVLLHRKGINNIMHGSRYFNFGSGENTNGPNHIDMFLRRPNWRNAYTMHIKKNLVCNVAVSDDHTFATPYENNSEADSSDDEWWITDAATSQVNYSIVGLHSPFDGSNSIFGEPAGVGIYDDTYANINMVCGWNSKTNTIIEVPQVLNDGDPTKDSNPHAHFRPTVGNNPSVTKYQQIRGDFIMGTIDITATNYDANGYTWSLRWTDGFFEAVNQNGTRVLGFDFFTGNPFQNIEDSNGVIQRSRTWSYTPECMGIEEIVRWKANGHIGQNNTLIYNEFDMRIATTF